MASRWSAQWGGAGGDAWAWGSPQGSNKGKGGGGKHKGGGFSKGKAKGKQQDDPMAAWGVQPEASAEGCFGEQDEQAAPPGTSRILSRYQFLKALLRTAPNAEGSVFVKSKFHQKQDDFTYLSSKELKKRLTSDDHHLLRRPGVGLSEAASAIQAGSDILKNLKQLDLEGLERILSDNSIVEALRVLNTWDEAGGQRDHKALTTALGALHEKLVKEDNNLEELAVKATVAASRLYVMGAHLLPLAAALGDPAWWQEKLPAEILDNERGSRWKAAPQDPQKMLSALAALLRQKIEEQEGQGKNDAASLFARKVGPPQARASPSPKRSESDGPDSDSSAKKKKDKKRKAKTSKKSKKDKAKKSKKRKSSSSTAASSKTSSVKPKDKKDKKDTKQKRKEPEEKAEKPRKDKPAAKAAHKAAVTVRRITTAVEDGRIELTDEDPKDDVDIVNDHMTVGEVADKALISLGLEDDADNWECKLVEKNGEVSRVARDFPARELESELILVAKTN